MEGFNSNYGQAQLGGMPFTTGKVFFVDDNSGSNIAVNNLFFKPDSDGTGRLHATPTSALAQCVAGHGDVIVLAPDFSTALTAPELLSAEIKEVSIVQAGQNINGSYSVHRATAALPQTTAEALFTVTGRIKLLEIIGVVTTVIQTQANNTKLVANPIVGADVDICAVLDITGDAVGTFYNITGTFADPLVGSTSGAGVAQVAPTIIEAGTLDLDCSASNTGEIKWQIVYESLDPGAFVFAA